MRFIKMHGLGNDFVLIKKAELDNRDIIKNLSDRHCGIGFDQAIIIDDFDKNSDFLTVTFLNADGSHSGACGNGTRAVAGYFYRETQKTEFNIHITLPNGNIDILQAHIIQDGIANIKMPNPKFLAEQIPLYDLNLNPQSLETSHFNHVGFCVNVGNPHIVFIVDDCLHIPLDNIGHKIEIDSLFPERINVEFIHIINKNTIRMRVWERGAGITKACGTGACASVIASVVQGLTDNKTTVIMDGGSLDIDYNPQTQDLYMQGGYHFVFEGHLL